MCAQNLTFWTPSWGGTPTRRDVLFVKINQQLKYMAYNFYFFFLVCMYLHFWHECSTLLSDFSVETL